LLLQNLIADIFGSDSVVRIADMQNLLRDIDDGCFVRYAAINASDVEKQAIVNWALDGYTSRI